MSGQINTSLLEQNWNNLAGQTHMYHGCQITPEVTGRTLYFDFECVSKTGIAGLGHVNFQPDASKNPWFVAHVSILKGPLTDNVKIAYWFQVEKVGQNGDIRSVVKVPVKKKDTHKNLSALPDGLFNAMKAFLGDVYRGTVS